MSQLLTVRQIVDSLPLSVCFEDYNWNQCQWIRIFRFQEVNFFSYTCIFTEGYIHPEQFVILAFSTVDKTAVSFLQIFLIHSWIMDIPDTLVNQGCIWYNHEKWIFLTRSWIMDISDLFVNHGISDPLRHSWSMLTFACSMI